MSDETRQLIFGSGKRCADVRRTIDSAINHLEGAAFQMHHAKQARVVYDAEFVRMLDDGIRAIAPLRSFLLELRKTTYAIEKGEQPGSYRGNYDVASLFGPNDPWPGGKEPTTSNEGR